MPKVRGEWIISYFTKANYLMQIADFLKVNIKIEARTSGTGTVFAKIASRLNSVRGTQRFTKPSQTNSYQ